MSQYREELRYYGDLARFATIFDILSASLGLKLPRSTNVPSSYPIELDAASRRTGASRLPFPALVIRMLLAIAQRALETPIIRIDLDSQVEENALRRQQLSAVSREMKSWESKKKKLEEARAKSKSGTATKEAKSQVRCPFVSLPNISSSIKKLVRTR